MPSSTLSTVTLNGPAALRALAAAFSHVDDFGRFVGALQTALSQAHFFERTQIQLDQTLADVEAHFSPGVVSLPLSRAGAHHGTLQISPGGEHRQFGAEDLHLMAGLADFLSAVLAQALRAQDAARTRELFRLLLNQAPVGIAAYTTAGRLLIANDHATRWLGDTPPPFAELAAGDGGFHLRTSGKLIYGEARRTTAGDPAGDWLVVLHDLTGDQVRLLDQMKRETYRALADDREFGFALIESATVNQGVLRRLAGIRTALHEGELAGPYDAQRVGLVLSASGLGLRARLRKLRTVLAGLDGLRLGLAELGRHGRAPDALLQAALQNCGGYDDLLKRSVLVHDTNPAVTATLAMVLGREFRVVKSDSSERTRELLAEQPFEGIFTDLDARSGPGGIEMARLARALQPGIRPFLTTIQTAPHDGIPADAIVVEKPFEVASLTALVRSKLPD